MQHATNDMLAKDLYTLAGQFTGFEGQMDEIRSLVKEGFQKIELRLDKIELQQRVAEAENSERKGKHKTVGWIADTIKGLIYAVIGAVAGAAGGHFLK
jgi:tetrahydromethanopterin S-methyltransferase subunit G